MRGRGTTLVRSPTSQRAGGSLPLLRGSATLPTYPCFGMKMQLFLIPHALFQQRPYKLQRAISYKKDIPVPWIGLDHRSSIEACGQTALQRGAPFWAWALITWLQRNISSLQQPLLYTKRKKYSGFGPVNKILAFFFSEICPPHKFTPPQFQKGQCLHRWPSVQTHWGHNKDKSNMKKKSTLSLYQSRSNPNRRTPITKH